MIDLSTAKKFTDSGYLPRNPGSLGRSLFQGIIDEVVTFINGVVKPEIALKAVKTDVDTALALKAVKTEVENTASLAGNGWFKDKKTGCIHQWGSLTVGGGGGNLVTFPIAFPAHMFSVVATSQAGAALIINTVTLTGFNIGGAGLANWIAIGN
jgi:hypothetical protein